eukprot:TRINITY_DN21897_c0_g2_i1.p1 TRINITY_DN21897_c0_g2~~TRINITY_DN21897_c0_g2_i1.p1  ORF type:complete len:631 (+),score=119.56 TRINITY_DN21897_c0_g2_i1:155-2047(+)
MASMSYVQSDDDDGHGCVGGSHGQAASPSSCGATNSYRPTSVGSPFPEHRPLGLNFAKGGPIGSGTAALSWKDGRFSDWPLKIGEQTYQLHAFLLARASQFFERQLTAVSAPEPGTQAPPRGSDLTEVLPQSCHAAFEDALDFIYSENQAAFEAPATKSLLLLKIADILCIPGLFEAMKVRIEGAFGETAPLLLEQYCRFHAPGTEDGSALQQLRENAVDLVVRKFQPFLAQPEMKDAMFRLPSSILCDILQADELLVASEDTVVDFVRSRAESLEGGVGPDNSTGASPRLSLEAVAATTAEVAIVEAVVASSSASAACGSMQEDVDALWECIRWPHVSALKFKEALSLVPQLMKQEVAVRALTQRVADLDLGALDLPNPTPSATPTLGLLGPSLPVPEPRSPILPPGVPKPTSIEIDFCFHYNTAAQFASGQALRSHPRRVGDLVLRVLVFPCGTDTGVAHGSLSVFLEAVPQPHWPRDWEFTNIRYALSCMRWPTGSGETWAAKRKSDLWTFKANRLDRGWHDFLSPGEVTRYLSPEGFVCLRGSLDPECLTRAFIFPNHSGAQGSSYVNHGEAAGSSASRRSWAPARVASSPTAPSPAPGGSGAGNAAIPPTVGVPLLPIGMVADDP